MQRDDVSVDETVLQPNLMMPTDIDKGPKDS